MLKLVSHDDKILKTVIPEYNGNYMFESSELDLLHIYGLLKEMIEVMTNSYGIGLAANQVGLNLRMFVMGSNQLGYCLAINPEIVEQSDEHIFIEEGCLSFPNLKINIKRPKYITLKYMNIYGEDKIIKCDEILSRVSQHELDHLNAITFDTKVSKLKLKQIKEKLGIHYDF